MMVRSYLWLASVVLTLLTFTWQDRTGPTQPLTGTVSTQAGRVRFLFVRSETIGKELPIVLLDPVPAGVTGRVQYRRYRSTDSWTVVPMARGTFSFDRRGRTSSVTGVGARLPGLRERAGKYEMFLEIDSGNGLFVSLTGTKPVYARFKATVPTWALGAHIFAIFISMMFAIRTVLEAVIDGEVHRLIAATLGSLVLGAFLLGPLIQWYAFGVWWAGIPFGYDWTDNKVLVSLLAWGVAAWANRGGRRNLTAIYAAGVVTLLVYFIPHSVFGSEYDYTTGTGHGTAG